MRWISAGCMAVAMMAAALVGAPSAGAQEQLATGCWPPFFDEDNSAGGFVGQPFTPQVAGPLTRVELQVNFGTGNWIVQITTSPKGPPTQDVLASSTIPSSSLPNGQGIVSFPFTKPATVSTGQYYAITVTNTDPYAFGFGGANCPNYPTIWASDDGITWYFQSGNPVSLAFRAFVDGQSCAGKDATIAGTSGNDQLVGTGRRDVISGLGGNDKVSGLGGNDVICGGPGKDTILGGSGTDSLLGQGGKDALKGGGKNDLCRGGKGKDTAKCEVEKSI